MENGMATPGREDSSNHRAAEDPHAFAGKLTVVPQLQIVEKVSSGGFAEPGMFKGFMLRKLEHKPPPTQ